MLKMKKTSVILLVLVGLLAVSSVALAGHTDEHAEDTQFSFGYDLDNHLLAINIGPNYEPYNCQFQNGTLRATYGAEAAGVISIDELDLSTSINADGISTKEFDARPLEDLPEGEFEATLTTVPYTGTSGECVVSGVMRQSVSGLEVPTHCECWQPCRSVRAMRWDDAPAGL